jgi:hypothetical protein
MYVVLDGAWRRGQSVRLAIAKLKQRSQRSVIGLVTIIYYVELLRSFEGTLICWSCLHL